MDVDRARVVAAILAIEDAILADRACEIVRETELGACEIVRRACAEQGPLVEEWSAALHADAELLRLFDQALVEIVDPPDPGPYAPLSLGAGADGRRLDAARVRRGDPRVSGSRRRTRQGAPCSRTPVRDDAP